MTGKTSDKPETLGRTGFLRTLLKAFGVLLMVFLTGYAFGADPARLDLSAGFGSGLPAFFSMFRAEFGGMNVCLALMTGAAGCLYLFSVFLRPRRPFVYAVVLAALFSLFLFLGDSFSVSHDFTYILYRKAQMMIAGIVFLGRGIFFTFLTDLLFLWLDRAPRKERPALDLTKRKVRFQFLWFALILIVLWAGPYAVFFPGSLPHDGRYQLNMFFGLNDLTTHHPYWSTMLLGGLYSLGSRLGDWGGAFSVALFQILLGALVFGSVSAYIRRKAGLLPAVLALLFYAACPVFWTFLQAVMKDTSYFILVTAFLLALVKIVLGDHGRKDWFILAGSGAAACLLRNDGAFLIFPALLLLVPIHLKKKALLWRSVAVLLAAGLVYAGLGIFWVRHLGIKPANQVEAISVPLNQAANYVRKHRAEVTAEEAAVINRIVVYEGIWDRYDPENADPVKNRYRKNIRDEHFSAFRRLYFNWLRKHPGSFLESLVNQSFGYLDPTYFLDDIGHVWYIKGAMGEADRDVVYTKYLLGGQWEIISAYKKMKTIPVLSLLINPASYTWVFLISITQALRRKRFRLLCVFSVPLMNLLMCFASPVNGYVRYALPLMAAAPLLVLLAGRGGFLFCEKYEKKP